MPTKFILDRLRKEEEETIARIFEVVKKEAYPSKNTTVLANFVHAMFQVSQKGAAPKRPAAEVKPVIAAKPMMVRPKLPPLPEPPSFHMPEPVPMPEMPALTPVPSEKPGKETLLPMPAEEKPVKFEGKSYTVTTFGMPVGVSIEKDATGKPLYKLNEPQISNDALKLTKEYVADDFRKDFKVLDNSDYINKKIAKACKKSDVECSPEYIKNIVYYLKRDLLGFRRIDPLIYDDNVKAIYCDGLNKPVTIEFRDIGKVKTNIVFSETKDLNNLLAKLAKATGSELSESKPILDTVYQGYRIQAVLGIGDASSKLIIKKE